jgi:hypothetical protein
VKLLLKVTPEEDQRFTAEVLSGDKSRMPGMVRASLGCYNTEGDIDALVEMLGRITRGDVRGRYVQDRASGGFAAEGFAPDFLKYFPYISRTARGERRHSEAS